MGEGGWSGSETNRSQHKKAVLLTPHKAEPDSRNRPAEAPTPAAGSDRTDPHMTPVVTGAAVPPQTGTGRRGTASSLRPGPLLSSHPQPRAASGPGSRTPGRQVPGETAAPPPRPHPSALQRGSPPAPPSGPAFPSRLSPGSARGRLSPHSGWPAAGAACVWGQTPTAWELTLGQPLQF